MTKQHKLTEIEVIRLSPVQKQTLSEIQNKYLIPKGKFIRDAIREKIERERKNITEPKVNLPF